jgi:hypothetical protein
MGKPHRSGNKCCLGDRTTKLLTGFGGFLDSVERLTRPSALQILLTPRVWPISKLFDPIDYLDAASAIMTADLLAISIRNSDD